MASIISPRRTDRLFFPLIALLLWFYVLLGFWPSYIGAGLVFAKLPSPLVHLHSILYVGWIGLFIAQIALVETRHVATHRKLGILLAWWAAAMVLVGPATAIMALRREPSGLSTGGLAGDLAQTVAFAILISAGLARRSNAPEHNAIHDLIRLIRAPVRMLAVSCVSEPKCGCRARRRWAKLAHGNQGLASGRTAAREAAGQRSRRSIGR